MNLGLPSFDDAFKPDVFRPQHDELLDDQHGPRESPEAAQARMEKEKADTALAVYQGLADLENAVEALSRERASAADKLFFRSSALDTVTAKADVHLLTLRSLVQAAKSLERDAKQEQKMNDLEIRLTKLKSKT